MHRRTFLASALAAAGRKPNVLLILTDDQRADTIGALGNPHIRTPNLDALARRGMVFRNAYCMGGNSAAVCLPSRNMIMSGRAYTRYGAQAPAADANFPDAMREAGYETYHHGKRGNTAVEIQARFETCKYLDEVAARVSAAPGRLIAEDAIRFLETRRRERPFFMSLSLEAPHDPRVPEARDRALYDRVPAPRNFLPVHPFDNGEMTVRDELLAAWPRTREEIGRQLAEYYAVITGIDGQVGRVLAKVDATDTFVIFTSDQGVALGSHGLLGKQSLYDAAMKVPLIIAGPGVRAGESDALVYLMDLMPTVLELAGARVPAGLDGRSFAPCVTGGSRRARESLFFGYRACQRAVRDERYKLIVYPDVGRRQLFDLREDPDEMRDLSEREPERVGAMMRRLAELQKQFGDALPLEGASTGGGAWTPPGGEELNRMRAKWKMPPV